MLSHRMRMLVLAIVAIVLLVVPGNSGAAPTSLNVGLYCISLGHQRLECHFEVSGGTGVYTYRWTPPASRVAEDVGIAIIPCARAYSYQTVYLNVTDSSGATGSASTTTFCGDAD
ncbi:MAG TPA: hypothetical protein VGV59_05430 [Pyrinomonadaceae bacterium]|nr:hypothetical protein [Pyrinomonadaceae bacterium]